MDSEDLSYADSADNSSNRGDISDSLSDSISINLSVRNLPIEAVVHIRNGALQSANNHGAFDDNEIQPTNELLLMSKGKKRNVHVSISSEDKVINYLQDRPVHISRTNIYRYHPSQVQATIFIIVIMLFVIFFVLFYFYKSNN